jgi:von Willebrand factor type A domain
MRAIESSSTNGARGVAETSAKRGGLASSPLTDPKSLASSLFFHIVLIAIIAAAAVRVAMPSGAARQPSIRAELGPVDNAAPVSTGGGAPGALGSDSLPENFRIAADGRSAESAAVRDPAADALLAEVLPAPPSADAAARALPGVISTGVGVATGPGAGGGGGSGGGSGGGVGSGTGPGTEFFGAREQAGSFAYVIDCSGSMAEYGALDIAKRELLASLRQLPPDARFSVIFYNLKATVFADADGRASLMPASAENKERVRTRLSTVEPVGGTDHNNALRAAFALKPEVVFFLTDANELPQEQVRALIEEAGPIRIQAIEFGTGPEPLSGGPIQRLAAVTGGQYRHIDVTSFRRNGR